MPGDRIFGLTSRVLEQRDGYPPLSIIYGATVTEVLDAAVYYGPQSPHRWRPDCIYRYDPAMGTLEHSGETGLHADPRHRRRDLGREGVFENGRILLCGDFTYLGPEALAIPENLVRLRSMAAALGQGHRVIGMGKDRLLEAELTEMWRLLRGIPTRHTPQEVHADSYDHPAPGPAERSGIGPATHRGVGLCTL